LDDKNGVEIHNCFIFALLGHVSVGNRTLSSNTRGIDEGTGFLDDFWNNIVTVISALGSAATDFALYFVWKQARMAQNEVASTSRPRISSSHVKSETESCQSAT
jgi:hypothetical protein